jgi:hypothetical protein
MKKLVVLAIFTLSFLSSCVNKPNACECADILNIPTHKVGIGMPLPIEHLSNEDFIKYEKCYDAYAGPATATLKCAGR